MSTQRPAGIRGEMTRLYDVFVDWDSRLAREIPGIEAALRGVGASRVLDVGCGTGRHVRALRERGFAASGADASPEMLARAAEHLGGERDLHAWRLGDPPPAALRDAGPFDAVLALGNMWPSIRLDGDLRAALAALSELLRPDGLVLLGLKAFRVRQATGNPYLPLLRRVHEGRPLWFVRFVDFLAAPDEPVPTCDLHMAVVAGDASGATAPEALVHTTSRVRAWAPDELAAAFTTAGFERVRVSGRIDDPAASVTGEDVFLFARRPAR